MGTMELKTIDGYEKYSVSRCGKVYSNNTGRFLKPNENGTGYLTVELYKNGKCKRYYIHRLVASAFVYNPDVENLRDVNHKNRNRADNRVDNLEWVTRSQNIIHGFKSGKHKKAKLSAEDVRSIIELRAIYTQKELSNKYGVSRVQVARIQTGKHWSNIIENL